MDVHKAALILAHIDALRAVLAGDDSNPEKLEQMQVLIRELRSELTKN